MKNWILEDAERSDIAYHIYMDDTKITDNVCDVYRTSDEMQDKKNAQMIAAAPQMQEALNLINQYSAGGDPEMVIVNLKIIASNALLSQSNK